MPSPAMALPATAQGWLYELLRWAGVSDPTASHVQQVLVKPVTVVAVLVGAAVVGWLGNRAIRHWIGAAFRHAASRTDSPRAERRVVTLTTMIANVWRVVVAVIAVLVALETIGINLTPLLAGATVVGAALGFGAQSMVRDFLSGFLLTVEGQFDLGDTVVVGDTTGVVEDITLRVTRLRGADGAIWFVPNGEIRTLGNTTRGWARATVDVAVPSGTDVERALDDLAAAADELRGDSRYAPAFEDAPVVWGVVATAVDSLTLRVTVRTSPAERDRLERALRGAVLTRLRGAGVWGQPA
ncbi:MAG: mechanosensitive ion channel family protein [Acidimicrobiales bacterium]